MVDLFACEDNMCLCERSPGTSLELNVIFFSFVVANNVENMASATPSYASTKETTNFAHLCRLLVDVGSKALRDKFDSIHPPAGLHGVLTKPPAHLHCRCLEKREFSILINGPSCIPLNHWYLQMILMSPF